MTMVRFTFAGLGACLLPAAVLVCAPAAAQSLYVSTEGSDEWSGLLPAPNAAGDDGPVATLARARDELRRLRAEGDREAPATIYLRGGRYYLTETLELSAEDSGSPQAPLTICSYPGERAVLVGGQAVTGFRPWQGEILQADMAAQGLEGVQFRDLYVDGERQHLARYPNFDPERPIAGGWAYVDGEEQAVPRREDGLPDRFQYKPQDTREWAHPEDVEVFVFGHYCYWNDILPIKEIDRETRTVVLDGRVLGAICPENRYFFRNALEELDAPGEWFLDRRTWTLYFWPPEDLAGREVRVPVPERLISIEGARDIVIRDLTMECIAEAAVVASDVERILVVGNTIRNVGGFRTYAVSMTGAGCGVVGNDIYDIGSTAIRLDGGDFETLEPANNYADNNYIHHTGVYFKQGIGVWIEGVGSRATHNLIHDSPRWGIFFRGNEHTVEFNHIRHVNLETIDTGGIYSYQVDWVRRGNLVRYNLIHDSLGFGRSRGRWVSPMYAWGIFMDGGTSGTTVYGNICVRAPYGGGSNGGGRDNRWENNIFVDGFDRQMNWHGWMKARGLERMQFMFDKLNLYRDNPVYRERYPELWSVPDPEQMIEQGNNTFRRNIISYREPGALLHTGSNIPWDDWDCDYNLIWRHGHPVLCGVPGVPPEGQWEAWREQRGADRNSIIADPLFVDPDNDDYRLRPDSPAFALGFEPIPVERIGPYESADRASWPIAEAPGVRERPIQAEPPTPRPAPGAAQARRGDRPQATVPRVTTPPVLDGSLSEGEWPGEAIALQESPVGARVAPPSHLWLACDDANLYAAVRSPIAGPDRVDRGLVWGRGDAFELCFQEVTPEGREPVYVVQVYAGGRIISTTDAGAPAEKADALAEGLDFAVGIGQADWTAEVLIPLTNVGIIPRPGLKLAFNIGLRRMERAEWVMWTGTHGPTFALEAAGDVTLQ